MSREGELVLLTEKDTPIAYDEEDQALIDELVEEGWGVKAQLEGAGEKDTSLMPVPPTDAEGKVIKMPHRFAFKKRSYAQIFKDREDISRLYLQGQSHKQIAEWIAENRPYQLTTRTISNDIQHMLRDWQISYLSDMNKAKTRELLKLDNVERELWETWGKSQEDIVEYQKTVVIGKNDQNPEDDEDVQAELEDIDRDLSSRDTKSDEDGTVFRQKEKTSKRKTPKPGASGSMSQGKGFVRTRIYEKRTSSYGDIRIIEMVLKTIELRAKILGIVSNKSDVNVNWRIQAKQQGYDPDEVLADFQQKYMDSEQQQLGDGTIEGEFKEQ